MDAFPKQYLPCHTVRLLKQFLTYGSSFQMVSTKTADTSHEILPTRQKCTKMCVRYILNPSPLPDREHKYRAAQFKTGHLAILFWMRLFGISARTPSVRSLHSFPQSLRAIAI